MTRQLFLRLSNRKVSNMWMKTGGAATPLPSRGGVAEGRGGVCKYQTARNIQTPPLPLPLKGGEWLRTESFSDFSCSDFLKWTHNFSSANFAELK